MLPSMEEKITPDLCSCMRPLLAGYVENRRRDLEEIFLELKLGNLKAISDKAREISVSSASFGLPQLERASLSLVEASDRGDWAETARLIVLIANVLDHIEL